MTFNHFLFNFRFEKLELSPFWNQPMHSKRPKIKGNVQLIGLRANRRYTKRWLHAFYLLKILWHIDLKITVLVWEFESDDSSKGWLLCLIFFNVLVLSWDSSSVLKRLFWSRVSRKYSKECKRYQQCQTSQETVSPNSKNSCQRKQFQNSTVTTSRFHV